MPISGTGTSSDPFMVHTALELRTALTLLDGSYVKMANNIDCNDDCRRWTTLDVAASYLLMDNHDLLNIYATDGAIVFNKTNGLFKIQNGRILNLTLINSVFNVSNYSNTGTDTDKYNNVLYDVAIKTTITGCGSQGYIFNKGTYFDYCNVEVKSTLPTSSHHVFYGGSVVNCGACFNDSKLVANTNNQDVAGATYPFGISGNFRNSRVEAKTDIECASGNYALGINSSATSSIFELKGNPNHQFSYLSASSSGVNPFNAGEMTITSPRTSEIPCSAAQMRNSAYLNSIGFPNTKVV